MDKLFIRAGLFISRYFFATYIVAWNSICTRPENHSRDLRSTSANQYLQWTKAKNTENRIHVGDLLKIELTSAMFRLFPQKPSLQSTTWYLLHINSRFSLWSHMIVIHIQYTCITTAEKGGQLPYRHLLLIRWTMRIEGPSNGWLNIEKTKGFMGSTIPKSIWDVSCWSMNKWSLVTANVEG